MRTPTALLCIRAAFGSRSAQTTLDDRRAVKTPILTAIRNDNREWKKGREELRSSFDPPRSDPAPRAGAPSLFLRAVRSPAWAAPRVTALPDNHSWLHHGFGGSALRDFLDPRCDRSTADLFGESRLDGGAGAAAESEWDAVSVTAPPSSPHDMAHTLFTTPTQDDMMTDILAELTQRYGVPVRLLGDVVDDSAWQEAPLRTL
jgi:hypothetical protein